MVDRYTKVVLTVIAAALLWLCLWGTPDINIAEVGGHRVRSSGIRVRGPVQVDGSVHVYGSVDCN